MARRRNKAVTREAILAAAREVLASDGPEALSLSKVAHLAGINRGTAYQHFETREDLVQATVDWVSEHLSATIFSNIDYDEHGRLPDAKARPVNEVIDGLVDFAVDNPALCRIWLFEVLSSDNPGDDLFFRQFESSIKELAESDDSQEGIDSEALSVLMLAGYFLWPVWVKARANTPEERQAMAKRMRREVLRLSLHGILKPGSFVHLQPLLDKTP